MSASDASRAARRRRSTSMNRSRTRAPGRWGRHDSAFGRALLDAASGKRENAPYSLFYGATPPSAINAYGVDRQVETGRTFLRLLAADSGAALRAAWAAGWEAVNEALATASRAKKDATLAEAPHSVAEALYVDDVNKELDRLEGDLLKRFPGDRATVDAFLAPTRTVVHKKKVAPSDGPHPAAE